MITKTQKNILTAALLAVGFSVSTSAQVTKPEPLPKSSPTPVTGSSVTPKPARPAAEEVTPEQRKIWEDITKASREEAAPVRTKMNQTRREMNEAVRAEKMDEALIRAKAADLGKLEGDIAVLDAKTNAKLRSQLTQDQIDRIRRTPMFQNRPNNSAVRSSSSTNLPGPVPAQSAPKAK